MTFPFYEQQDALDCGPTCLRIISKFYGKSIPIQILREKCSITKEGVSFKAISDGAESIGFRTLAAKVNYERISKAPLPLICHWDQRHFVVVYDIKSKVTVADPQEKKIKEISKEEFIDHWQFGSQDGRGVILLLEKTPSFDEIEFERGRVGISSLAKYLQPHKTQFFQVLIATIIGLVLQIAFPFLTQSIVDVGISYQDLTFINVILIAQLAFFISRTAIEFIRNWILLYIGSKINLSIVSNFLAKLLRLELRYFDTKTSGDLLQRIQDNRRLEEFLTTVITSTILSVITLLVFGVILAYYHLGIFSIFLLGTVLYVLWILLFLTQKRALDHEMFRFGVESQSQLIQLLNGIKEIKLFNIQNIRRWKWEVLQASLFNLKIKSLKVTQSQRLGSSFINEMKNIFITFYAAKLVITGDITLGMMLSIQYILGQLNSPVSQIITFIEFLQQANISLERLNEVHNEGDEEQPNTIILSEPSSRSLILEDLSFRYDKYSKNVLKNISLVIPNNKVTAIVGDSGSGKSTLVKLLLKMYKPSEGNIKLGETDLSVINHSSWRGQCGAVLQDGFIFNETIAYNIALNNEDSSRLFQAAKNANILDFITSLPLGFNSRIGEDGINISQGQKQRLLIARAIYSDPKFLFLDESTNALDANNEKIIMGNLNKFFTARTVIIVAHRLSTVKNADQIVVLKNGCISEIGNHDQLIEKKGDYYTLVHNQLNLAN